jgi:hypothetical protein
MRPIALAMMWLLVLKTIIQIIPLLIAVLIIASIYWRKP